MDCKCTRHDAHAGWRNLFRTLCRASLLRSIIGRFEWWSTWRIQAGVTGVGNVQILAGSTGPGAKGRDRIRAVGIPPGTAGKCSLENMEILAGKAVAGSAVIADAATGGSTRSATPHPPGNPGPTGARRPWSGPKYKFCNAAGWRQRATDPAARRSPCTDPAKNGWSRNNSAEPGAEPSGSATPARINLFRARATWLGATVANLCTVHAGAKYAGPIGSGPAESAPSVTTCSPACSVSKTSNWSQTEHPSALPTAQACSALCKLPTWQTGLLAACARSSTAGKQPFELGWAAVV